MARKVSTIITDDIDGSQGAEAVGFGIDGMAYEIDLGPANRERLHSSLLPFIAAGRRAGQRKSARRTRSRSDTTAIRSWAQEQGLHIAERGRISAEIVSQYDAAHK